MAIYIDKVHMVSDNSVDELHTFAETIGLKRHWFEGVRKWRPHYDLVNKKKIPLICKETSKTFIDKAIENGAILARPREILIICRKIYGNNQTKITFKTENDNQDEKH